MIVITNLDVKNNSLQLISLLLLEAVSLKPMKNVSVAIIFDLISILFYIFLSLHGDDLNVSNAVFITPPLPTLQLCCEFVTTFSICRNFEQRIFFLFP